MLPLDQEIRRAHAFEGEAVKKLEDDNQRLMGFVTDLALDKEILRDVTRRKF